MPSRRPRVRAALSLLCLAVAAGCSDALAPLPDDVPSELTYVVNGGLAGTVLELRLEGNTVVLVSGSRGPLATPWVVRRVPSAAEWRDFARAAADAGVRRWPRRCSDDRVADGSGFSYTLATGGVRLAGDYYVESPTAGGRCSGGDRADAQAFGRAVLGLAGVATAD